jgi:hypothetical protein
MGGVQVRARYASVAANLLSSVLILLLPVVSFQVIAKAGAEKNSVVPSDCRGEIVGLQSQQDSSSNDATINCDNTTEAQASPAPTLSGAWLYEQPRDIGKPKLYISTYNLSEGLLAGYQSETGKRILFRSMWRKNGAVIAEAAHLNPQTRKIELIFGRTTKIDAATNKRAKQIDIAGIDLLQYLSDGVLKRKGPSQGHDEVRDFLASDAGQAFSGAIPALYAGLESLETDPALAKLHAPFGAVLTAIQLRVCIEALQTQMKSLESRKPKS